MAKFKVTLTEDERSELQSLMKKGKAAARKINHARILLLADEGEFGPCKTDAEVVAALQTSVRTVDRVDGDFPQARRIRLVMDNLNTHTGAALYETFPPAEARRLLEKLEFHDTPKHASWLNMAEIEIGIMSRQCLNRRIADRAVLAREVAAWETDRNHRQAKIHWTFTIETARRKLNKLYPSIEG